MRDRRGLTAINSKSFDPRMVPEIAAGYFWEADAATGFGTSAFKVPEGNGHTSADLLQATVATQPTRLTENGGVQFRMRKAADANPSKMKSASFAAGWTGATYVGMWLRLPVDLTGTNNLFNHSTLVPSGLSRISLITVNGTPDIFRINLISGAQAFTNTTFATPFADLGWHWIEAIFDPLNTLGGSGQTDFAKAFTDLVQISKVVGGNHPSAIADVSAEVRLAQTSGDTATDTDDYDWAACYYGNGIPNIVHRMRLANRKNPTGVLVHA
jgi:hypothetical protein